VLVTWKLREEFDGKIIRRVGSLAAAKKTLAYEADANGSYTAIDPIPRRRGDRIVTFFAAVHMSAVGTKRRIAAARTFGRYWG
jgi:hypothetical protein